MGELTTDERVALKYLATKDGPIWGGIYERGGDALVLGLLGIGLIEAVREPYTAGGRTFSGGYRISPEGRAALDVSHG